MADIPGFLAVYNELVEKLRKANAEGLRALASSEAAIRTTLSKIPSDMGKVHVIFEALRKELFAMKDDVRKTQKTIRTLHGKVRKVGATVFDPDTPVDVKAITAALKSQRRLVDAIQRAHEELDKKRGEIGNMIDAALRHEKEEARKEKALSRKATR